MSTENKPQAQLGIQHKVVFEVPAGFHVECATSSDVKPAALVVKGSKYNPGYFYHSATEGTFGPFGSYEEACLCHPFTDVNLRGWIVIVPTVRVEV